MGKKRNKDKDKEEPLVEKLIIRRSRSKSPRRVRHAKESKDKDVKKRCAFQLV